jgi:drug/metabolite transporter (DMT)-like permease
MSRPLATLLGFGAVLTWSSLALLTVGAGDVPPLQLLAICFAIGGGAGLALRPRAWRAWRQPLRVWAPGVGGLFGYHLLYVLALRAAPPVQASLIAYLWPLLIVLMAAAGPGGRLRRHHLAGALLGFAGAALIVTDGGRDMSVRWDFAWGYGLALAAAFVWASYSVASSRLRSVPTDVITGFCLAAAVLSCGAHLMLEESVTPGPWDWLSVMGLGLGPLGLAFYLWDIGMKWGDVSVLGASSYAAPPLSTLLLVAVGLAVPSLSLVAACILIVAGAALASRDLWPGSRRG